MLREIYLTAFVIFFRIVKGGWKPRTQVGISTCGAASAAVITVIESWFLMAAVGWIEPKFLKAAPDWLLEVAFFVLYAANCYFFLVLRHGPVFAHEFPQFKKSKRALLLTSSMVMMLAAIAFFLYSALVHRSLVHHP